MYPISQKISQKSPHFKIIERNNTSSCEILCIIPVSIVENYPILSYTAGVFVFKDKYILITGAAKRIGKGLALSLAKKGSNIILHYNKSEAESIETEKELKEYGIDVVRIQCDLSDPVRAEGLMDEIEKKIARTDVLINSASIFPGNTLMNTCLKDFDKNINLNSLSPFFISRAFYKKLEKQNKKGSIINILDARMGGYTPLHFPYQISKRILSDITRISALEFSPLVRVNAIAPGNIVPPKGKGSGYIKKAIEAAPLKKHGSIKDITEGVFFLLGAEFITGQTLYIDGGRHLCGSLF